MSGIEEVQAEVNVLAAALAGYAQEQGDVLRFALRRTVDACTTVELLARTGPAGIDQAVCTVRDLREELFRIADGWLPDEQLMSYGDGSPITHNERTPAGQITRSYLPWTPQFSAAAPADPA